MQKSFAIAFVVTASLLLSGVAVAQSSDVQRPLEFADRHPTFDTYWYQGLAELNRYRLDQSRYGEVHDGEAVFIFVTEDFHRDIQVKWDRGDRAEAVPILKLNAYRRFYTGIYPYTIQTSVFAPVGGDNPNPLKISMSSIEWCGQTYSQINRREGQYEVTLHSYFQSEADRHFEVAETTTEDELFTRIRRDPESLPVGPVLVLPASHYLRMMHRQTEALPAIGQLEDVDSSPYNDSPARLYTLSYTGTERTVRIWFEPTFPNRILAWEEEGAALFNPSGGAPETLTTRAVLTDSILLDYWRYNGVDDAQWRDALGLTN